MAADAKPSICLVLARDAFATHVVCGWMDDVLREDTIERLCRARCYDNAECLSTLTLPHLNYDVISDTCHSDVMAQERLQQRMRLLTEVDGEALVTQIATLFGELVNDECRDALQACYARDCKVLASLFAMDTQTARDVLYGQYLRRASFSTYDGSLHIHRAHINTLVADGHAHRVHSLVLVHALCATTVSMSIGGGDLRMIAVACPFPHMVKDMHDALVAHMPAVDVTCVFHVDLIRGVSTQYYRMHNAHAYFGIGRCEPRVTMYTTPEKQTRNMVLTIRHGTDYNEKLSQRCASFIVTLPRKADS